MIAAIALAAALAGRMVEQTVGLARPGDLTAFYGLLGVAAALRLQAEPKEQPALQPSAAQKAHARAPARVSALRLGSAAIIGVLALALFLAVDVQAVRASRLATTAQQALRAKDVTTAYLRFRRASELYPFAEGYAVAASHLLRGSARQNKDREEAAIQLAIAFEVLSRFEEMDPYAYDTQIGLALTTAQLAALGAEGVKPILRDRLEKLARLLPGYSAILSFTAHGLVLADEYETALAHATRAIAIDPEGTDAQQAWWARGAALEALKRFPEAEKAYLRVLELDPGGGFSRDAHVGLANIYQDLGQTEESQKHRSLAGLKPGP
jgi:tetratricopeptide (TPR) repeat protein